MLRILLVASLIGVPALAQNVVVLRANTGGRVLVAPGARLTVPVVIDMAAAGGSTVASLATGVAWSTSKLAFDSVRSAGFGILTPNTANVASGSLGLSMSGSTTASTVTMGNVFFTAPAVTGGTTVVLSPSSATDGASANILSTLRTMALQVCVAQPGNWGDANNDASVNILDAQQIARFSVGLTVANQAITITQGDANGDNGVNILDAQQVARFSVGLSASARVNTAAFAPPSVSTLSISNVFDAAAGGVNPGVPANIGALAPGSQAQIQLLARDPNNADVTACATTTYSSSNPSVASVTATGLISATSAGTTTITVTSGALTAQQSINVAAGGGATVNAWTNASGGLWSSASNWSLGRIPNTTDSVVIAQPGTYTVTMDVNHSGSFITVGGGGGTPTLDATNRTLTLTGRLTNRSAAIVATRSSVINGPIANQGTVTVEGTTAFNGSITTAAGSLIRMQGNALCCGSTLIAANGFTNLGTIELTSVNGALSSTLVVTAGIVVNAPGGTIAMLAGGGNGGRFINGAIDNQGTLTIATPATITTGVGGLANSGTIDLAGGDLTLSMGSGIVATSGTLNIPSGRTMTVLNGSFTQPGGGIVSGGGTLVLNSVTTTLQDVALSGVTANNSVVTFGAAQSTANIAWTLISTTVNGAAFTNVAGQTLTVRSVTFNGPVTNQGTLIEEGLTTFNGALATGAGSILRSQGNTQCCGSTLTVANGFTNFGTIELTAIGGAISSALNVNAGTLVNAPGGTIASLPGAGNGSRSINAAIDNQGTLTIATGTSVNILNGGISNSGTLDVAGGDLIISQGSAGTVSSTGTLTIQTGRTLTINSGTFTQASGSTINGGGALVVNSVTSSLQSFSLASITANSATVTLGTPQSNASITWSLINATVNGAGFTNASGQTQLIRSATFNAPLTNQGTLLVEGLVTLNAPLTTVAGSLIRIQGNTLCCGATLTVANGFTNLGAIELTSVNGVIASSLNVNAGVLVNATGATISSLPGAGNGGRSINAAIDNQGIVTIAATATQNSGNGGVANSGTIDLTGGDLTISQGNSGSVATSGSLSIGAGRTLTINSGAFVQQNGATLGGGGALIFNSVTASLQNVTLASVTGNSATLTLGSPQSNASMAWTFTNTTVNGAAFTNAVGQTQLLRSVSFSAPLTNQGTLLVEGAVTLNAPLTTVAGSVIRVQGNTQCCGATLTVASGFTNLGTLELTSVNGTIGSTLNVLTGTLANAVGATISSLPGAGNGGRTINAVLDNQGSVTIAAATSINSSNGGVNNTGTIDLSGGDLSISQGSGGTVAVSGTLSIPVGRTLTINSGAFTQQNGGVLNGGGALVVNSVTSSLQNFSLASITANSATVTLGTPQSNAGVAWTFTNTTINGAAFTNAAGQTQLARSVTFNAPLTNQGTLLVEGAVTLNAALTTAAGSLIRMQGNATCCGSTFSVANGFTNFGALELTSVSGAIGATFNVTSGTLVNATGATLTALAGAGNGGRTINASIDNQGTITIATPTTLNVSNGGITNSGTIDVGGGDLTLAQGSGGSLLSSGTVAIASGRTLTINSGAFTQQSGSSLNGGGALVLNSVTASLQGFTLSSISANNAAVTLAAPQSTANTGWTFLNATVNGSTFTNASGQTVLARSSTFNAPLTNQGTLVVEGSVGVNGTLTTAPTSLIRIQGNGQCCGAALTVANGFTNTGAIELTSINGALPATLATTTGTFVNASGAAVTALVGSGFSTRSINGAFDNQGTLSLFPDGMGVLSLGGAFTNASTGTVNFKVGGATAGSGFDQLALTGTANLAGTLNLALVNGFTPGAQQTFQLITASAVSGGFSTTNLPSVGWSVQYQSNGMSARAP